MAGQVDSSHQDGPGCGHEAVPHGDHVDYRWTDVCTTGTRDIATTMDQSM